MSATLLERTRALLPAGPVVREVRMFGGVSLMLDERMLVAVRRDGLLVRVDPGRSAELLGIEGAGPAAMGAHRWMGPGWMDVSGAAVASDEQLTFWLQVALEHHAGSTAG